MVGDNDCLLIMLEADDLIEQTQTFVMFLTSDTATIGRNYFTTISIMDINCECDKCYAYYYIVYRRDKMGKCLEKQEQRSMCLFYEMCLLARINYYLSCPDVIKNCIMTVLTVVTSRVWYMVASYRKSE